jgi:hypothetical protein
MKYYDEEKKHISAAHCALHSLSVLRSHITLMRLRLRGKMLVRLRLRLLPYVLCSKPTFFNGTKVTIGMGTVYSYDFQHCYCSTVLIIRFGAGDGAASRYSSGYTKMMQLRAAPALQHCSL